MPLKNYGALVDRRLAATSSAHYQLRVVDDYRVAVSKLNLDC